MADYDELRGQLSGLLISMSTSLSFEETEEVQHFIDVDEFGIALETLCGIITDAPRPIRRDDFRQIVDLATRMNIPRSRWEHLEPLTTNS